MMTMRAEIQNGCIVPEHPVTWPNGTLVDIVTHDVEDEDIHGDSPEAIARWIAIAESIPAPEITEEEWQEQQTDWSRERQAQMQLLLNRETKISADPT